MARPHSALREGGLDIAIEEFVGPHSGVRTNHNAVFSHMMKCVVNGKFKISA